MMSKYSKTEEIQNKLDKYMKAKVPVHVVFKIKQKYNRFGDPMGPRFFNGIITGKKSEDVYIMDERKLGETYILLDDIFSITVYAKSNEMLIKEIKQKVGYKQGPGVFDEEIDLINDFPKENENDKNISRRADSKT